jgi:hypothetical protein
MTFEPVDVILAWAEERKLHPDLDTMAGKVDNMPRHSGKGAIFQRTIGKVIMGPGWTGGTVSISDPGRDPMYIGVIFWRAGSSKICVLTGQETTHVDLADPASLSHLDKCFGVA